MSLFSYRSSLGKLLHPPYVSRTANVSTSPGVAKKSMTPTAGYSGPNWDGTPSFPMVKSMTPLRYISRSPFGMNSSPGHASVSQGRRRYSRVPDAGIVVRSEEHTSELQSLAYLVCRLLLEKKKYWSYGSC